MCAALRLIAIVGLGGLLTSAAHAQPERKPTPRLTAASECIRCHRDGPADFEPIPICGCDEFNRWQKEDKHSRAFLVLLDKQAQDMQKLLQPRIADVTRAPECLSCHATVLDKQPLHESFSRKDPRLGREMGVVEGVTCVHCHGGYKEWITEHYDERVKWRKLERRDKERFAGMIDLWDPVRRAEVCASCHVGSPAEGKVVTHEMYAAGHPPLPGFEAATFSNEMPRHWEYLREKANRPQSGKLKPLPAEVLQLYRYDPARLEQTELLMVASLVTLRQSARLLAAQADDAHAEQWPELAAYSCDACHHELKRDGWRQQRGFKGRPGMHEWPSVLARLAVSRLDEAPALQKHLQSLHDAFAAQPFGDRARLRTAAGALDAWLSGTLPKAQAHPWTRQETRAILANIADAVQQETHDYHAARQLAWAYEILWPEAEPGRGPQLPSPFAPLAEHLGLRLPRGQRPLSEQLGRYLQLRSAYDPQRLRQLFKQLR